MADEKILVKDNHKQPLSYDEPLPLDHKWSYDGTIKGKHNGYWRVAGSPRFSGASSCKFWVPSYWWQTDGSLLLSPTLYQWHWQRHQGDELKPLCGGHSSQRFYGRWWFFEYGPGPPGSGNTCSQATLSGILADCYFGVGSYPLCFNMTVEQIHANPPFQWKLLCKLGAQKPYPDCIPCLSTGSFVLTVHGIPWWLTATSRDSASTTVPSPLQGSAMINQ